MSLTLPLVSQDLNTKQETIIAIGKLIGEVRVKGSNLYVSFSLPPPADLLDHLDKITEDVFGRIQVRIQDNVDRIRALDRRAKEAMEKVDMLRESKGKKATAVFSGARYPGERYKSYGSVFSSKTEDIIVPKRTQLNRKQVELASKELLRREVNVQEKLHFFHANSAKKNASLRDRRGDEDQTKSVPGSISAASSMLVFNTADNPYASSSGAISSDPLKSGRRRANKVGTKTGDEAKSLQEAPASLAGINDGETGIDNYYYSPDLDDDLPELDLPDFLELDNVAVDQIYSNGDLPAIGPSAPSTSSGHQQVEETPDLPPDIVSEPVAENDLVGKEAPSDSVVPPPPPPPPPIDVPPPPPPPPPPLPPVVDDSEHMAGNDDVGHDAPDGVVLPDAPANDGRASLMDEIRKKGGKERAGLKPVKEKKREEKLARQEEKEKGGSGGGDLMSDLAEKLDMRRKAFAGDNGGAMGKISSMIPPPPKGGPSDDDDDDDLDEDYDNAWDD